ncbi:MAG: type II secretion system F family protein [Gammaproteobacteria bacterium]|nr:MAG: type II secretion system F family protein [Gammaproteobacteria bacterium]
MPQFNYRGRDKEGQLRAGQRVAPSADQLNSDLIKEGIFPIHIAIVKEHADYLEKLQEWFQGQSLHTSELAIFARQMQLLHRAGVPIVTALQQLSSHTRSRRLAHALNGIIEHLEKGESLATAMQYYPSIFSPLMVNIIQIGESTGHLDQAFEHIHEYLEFETSTVKQIRSAFRYPIFVLISIAIAIVVLNLFVIPTFSRFFLNLSVSLPWQTRVLINISNFFVHDIYYLIAILVVGGFFLYRYLKSPQGKYRWNKLELRIPIFGKLLKRIILIRFCQSMSIILSSGLSVTQSLVLVKNIIPNAYIVAQISEMQDAIERGVPFTQALKKVDLFTHLEIQILAVGEKNGELSPALSYIGHFHGDEIAFDLKRISDMIGPVLMGFVSLLILIIALGIYLPIWNMINLTH